VDIQGADTLVKSIFLRLKPPASSAILGRDQQKEETHGCSHDADPRCRFQSLSLIHDYKMHGEVARWPRSMK
jgi:hypothetical protein